MSARYRERISEERLRAVTDRVEAWLLGPDKPPKKKRTESDKGT
jgi:hypothetical protein